MEARDQCDRLLEVQQEAERKAKQEAAAEVARLAASQRMQEVAARAAAAFKAREEAVVAVAKADALERAMAADGGEGGSSGAAGPSEASEASEVPDDYICPITAEIMTDPVSTADGFTYEREAISEWLRTKDTSPRTGAKFREQDAHPNPQPPQYHTQLRRGICGGAVLTIARRFNHYQMKCDLVSP